MILTGNLKQQLKLSNATKQRQKDLTVTLYSQTVTSLLYCRFMVNLEQSASQIPDAYPLKVTFSLTVTFYLQKLKTELKNISEPALTLLLWVKVLFFFQNCWYFAKKLLIIAKLRGSWYYKVYFLKLHTCLY